MKTYLAESSQPASQQPSKGISPYIWEDIGIIGFVVISVAIVLVRWLPNYLNERWEVRKREIEQNMLTVSKRDERDRQLVADTLNTLLSKELQRSQELLENLAQTQLNIAKFLESQTKMLQVQAEGFENNQANQASQVKLLGEILAELRRTRPPGLAPEQKP